MRVKCSVDEITLKNSSEMETPSVEATCGRCNHSTHSFGTSERSVRRCLVLMRNECPNDEENFYIAEGAGETE